MAKQTRPGHVCYLTYLNDLNSAEGRGGCTVGHRAPYFVLAVCSDKKSFF